MSSNASLAASVGLVIVLLSGGCGTHEPTFEPATTPEACIRNACRAAAAKDMSKLTACFAEEAADVIERARPKAAEIAKSVDALLQALKKNQLQGSADALVAQGHVDWFARFDKDLVSLFPESAGKEWRIAEKGQTTASAEVGGLKYPMVLENGSWKLRPHLPGCLALYLGKETKMIMGAAGWLLNRDEVPYTKVSDTLHVLEEARNMFDELTASVSTGQLTKNQEFLGRYNRSAESLR